MQVITASEFVEPHRPSRARRAEKSYDLLNIVHAMAEEWGRTAQWHRSPVWGFRLMTRTNVRDAEDASRRLQLALRGVQPPTLQRTGGYGELWLAEQKTSLGAGLTAFIEVFVDDGLLTNAIPHFASTRVLRVGRVEHEFLSRFQQVEEVVVRFGDEFFRR